MDTLGAIKSNKSHQNKNTSKVLPIFKKYYFAKINGQKG